MTQVPFADRQLTVHDPDTGRPVALTVREFRHREALTLTALARPLIADLAALTVEGESTSLPDALAIESVMAAHTDLWLELTARACDRDAAWLARLSDFDGRELSRAMWDANSGFFVRRWIALAQGRAEAEALHRFVSSSARAREPVTVAATRH